MIRPARTWALGPWALWVPWAPWAQGPRAAPNPQESPPQPSKPPKSPLPSQLPLGPGLMGPMGPIGPMAQGPMFWQDVLFLHSFCNSRIHAECIIFTFVLYSDRFSKTPLTPWFALLGTRAPCRQKYKNFGKPIDHGCFNRIWIGKGIGVGNPD